MGSVSQCVAASRDFCFRNLNLLPSSFNFYVHHMSQQKKTIYKSMDRTVLFPVMLNSAISWFHTETTNQAVFSVILVRAITCRYILWCGTCQD